MNVLINKARNNTPLGQSWRRSGGLERLLVACSETLDHCNCKHKASGHLPTDPRTAGFGGHHESGVGVTYLLPTSGQAAERDSSESCGSGCSASGRRGAAHPAGHVRCACVFRLPRRRWVRSARWVQTASSPELLHPPAITLMNASCCVFHVQVHQTSSHSPRALCGGIVSCAEGRSAAVLYLREQTVKLLD